MRGSSIRGSDILRLTDARKTPFWLKGFFHVQILAQRFPIGKSKSNILDIDALAGVTDLSGSAFGRPIMGCQG
jgi:hypothetical protein